mgnify:CR=1 FL=1
MCGRFEGIDERVIEHYGMLEVSLGDFVLSGGEIAALALLDAVVRLLPGVAGNAESLAEESFETGLLKTIRWYLDNTAWVESIRRGEYQKWISLNYDGPEAALARGTKAVQ